jgi:hypothetical protein
MEARQPHIFSKQNEPYLSIGKSSPIQAYHRPLCHPLTYTKYDHMITTNMFFKDILVPINPVELHIITCILNVSK